jgi:ADP-ribosylglycohydrolase
MAGASSPYQLLREEFVQRADEGCRIPPELRARFEALDAEAEDWAREKIDPIYDELMALPDEGELAAAEPNELEAIRALRPEGPRDLGWTPDEGELLDRLHGAWTGRCVGCALGKPVEGRGMGRDESGRLSGRKSIKRYLEARGDWPLRDYFSSRDVGDGDTISEGNCDRESISHMPPDDDIHYSLVGLGVLEDVGWEFTWADVGRYWLRHIPITAICTAEAQAILNFQNRTRQGRDGIATAEWTRRYRNPYREWIGAQIRSDGWAFASAGRPELAAELAWRDAHWTHERNGIYGEMMFAAMQAAAFVESDVERLIEIGLSEIPRDCRLARWVAKARGWMKEAADWEACMDLLEADLGEMHAVHTINNALICLIGLHYGEMDTTVTPATAVMCGLDTDCNGATVGSIVGAASGRKAFGGSLAARLNDLVKPNMLGFQEVTMTELAKRTAAVWRAAAGR